MKKRTIADLNLQESAFDLRFMISQVIVPVTAAKTTRSVIRFEYRLAILNLKLHSISEL